jgi:uncharacterized protein (DUF342 family)
MNDLDYAEQVLSSPPSLIEDNQSFDVSQPADTGSVSEQNETETPMPGCIQFFRNGLNNQLLVAALSPSKEFRTGLAINDVKKWIGQQGCEDWYVFEETILLLSRELRRLENQKEYIVAEKKDCEIEVIVAPDRLNAWIRVSPAYGGTPLTEELLMRRLEEKNVRFGIDGEQVQKILNEGWCEREPIATGIPSIPGEPAQFEQLVKESDHKGAPQERTDGSVDYKDLGLWISVVKETPLLKRIPPTIGTPGTGVDGKSIAAAPGADRSLLPGAGAVTSKDDPNVIIASRVGRPLFLENSVQVDPTLELDSVDPSTGNVIFDGNILIRGAVEAGYTVSAGQDLTILDTVEGAHLSAGRNLSLLTGVYGKNTSELKAKGNLEARFLSDCRIQCDGNLEVSDLISYCTVECDGSVFLGKSGGRGQAYGGRIRALKEIHTQILGSVSETATLIEVGPSKTLLLSRDKIKKEMDAIENELAIIGKNIRLLKSNTAGTDNDRINDFAVKAATLAEKFEEHKISLEDIDKKIEISERGKIRAAQVHRGVVLHVGSKTEIISEETTDLYLQPALEKMKNR